MCGIIGHINTAHQYRVDEIKNIVTAMTDALRHRGPDDSGIWMDSDAGIALGHCRLSIIDLSAAGHQPMHSTCGRYVIVFNGEIYNYHDIRDELAVGSQSASSPWRGNSDTEVMLAAISTWGVEAAVKRFSGMFAFALWDRRDRVLHLVRDRVGEKPLYYGTIGSSFIFGSELKAFRKHPAWSGEINREALALFFKHNYIPAPHSIFRNIYKLTPGTILTVPITRRNADIGIPKSYWSAKEIAELGGNDPFVGPDAEAVDALDALLRSAVKRQMVADVPLGAFLSGGIDSSIIVALMQAQSQRPVKSFTIGFDDDRYNEAVHAKSVARHLGTEHTELYVTAEQAMEVIPKLPTVYDEPFSDASQIPTYLVARLARTNVTVSLSGDAGDELFAGYNRYLWGKAIWSALDLMPTGLRNATAGILKTLSSQTWESIYDTLAPLVPNRLKQTNFGDKIQKLSQTVNAGDPHELYDKIVTHWQSSASLVLNAGAQRIAYFDPNTRPKIKDTIQLMMYLDLISYLPDDILTKVDRAAMSVSLETRMPYLDHRVVEFAWRMPITMNIRHSRGKWLLRQLLSRYVPHELTDRPKRGFAVPLDAWLRGPLRDWAEELLSEKRLMEGGYLDPAPIRTKWREHLSGKLNWQYHLWDALMFQSWLANEAQSTSNAAVHEHRCLSGIHGPEIRSPHALPDPGDSAGSQRSERGKLNSFLLKLQNRTEDPNHWFRSLFPTAHLLLVKRSLHSLELTDLSSILVVGAGYDPYRSIFPQAKEYIRLDIKHIPGITDVIGDALALPFDAGRFDCIFASELLEHLSDPFMFVREVARVVKPGGTVVLTVPFLFHMHGDPYDFWRPTGKGLTELFKQFTKVKVHPLGNSLHVISDLATTVFSPYPVLFPLRIFNHLLMLIPHNRFERLPSMAPSGHLIVATR